MFNPHPRIEAVSIGGRQTCWVIDDALRDPEALVAHAVAQRSAFAETGHNAYPGPELRMPDAFSAQLDAFFAAHVRRQLGARRTERMYSRLALTATLPERLSPSQSICHVDRLAVDPGQCVIASVLYLFHDPALGGTSFYAPKHPPETIVPLVLDANALDAVAFEAKYGLRTGYMTASNAYFEKVATVPARWNRMIFYTGTVFHTGEIAHPERLTDDPRTGRLTLNGFFTCRKSAT